MKIAITGGAGFIATVLARQLIAAGHDIVLLDLKHSDTYPDHSRIVDVTDEAALTNALKGCVAIYHLAAEHRDDVRPVQKYYDVNVGGAQALIAAAKAHKIKKIIFASSVAVYGLDQGESSENDSPYPFNDYGRSKLEAEHVLDAWVAEGKNRSLTSVRLVATFGPGNRGNIYNLMKQIAAGRFIMIGNGKNKKSISYVENAAAFFAHCLQNDEGRHVYNYADKPDLDMNMMVQTIRASLGKKGVGLRLPKIAGLLAGKCFDWTAEKTGKTFPISTVRVEKFCANTLVNADKARAGGFTPPHDLRAGLREMMAHEFPPAQQQKDAA